MSETEQPIFSVIIPLYNKREFILRAVRSVLMQELQDFELLVVDDGSSDGSARLVAELHNPKVRIIVQKNMGGAGGQARNTGMAQARGTWIAFLDADDIWLPNHLRELANLAETANRPALIATHPLELYEGDKIDVNNSDKSKISEVNYFFKAGENICQNNCTCTAIHQKIFTSIGGFILVKSGPDLEYWARIALDFPFYFSDKITTVYYRGNMGNMEIIAAQNMANKKEITIKSLSDVSPSLSMLAARNLHDPSLFRREDVRAYVNGRLSSGMIAWLRRSRPTQARQLSGLMIGELKPKVRIVRVASYLPRWILRILNAGYDFFKVIRRRA